MQQLQQFAERARDAIEDGLARLRDRWNAAQQNRQRDADRVYDANRNEEGEGFRFQGRSLLLGAFVGILVGLLIGWRIVPVNWQNAQLVDLGNEAQAHYLAAVADAYVARSDDTAALIARQRLFDLNANLAEEIAEAQRFFNDAEILDAPVRVQNLQILAQSLGVDDEVLAINSGRVDPVASSDNTASTESGPLDNSSAAGDDAATAAAAQDESANANSSSGGISGFWLLLLAILAAVPLFVWQQRRRERSESNDDLDREYDEQYRDSFAYDDGSDDAIDDSYVGAYGGYGEANPFAFDPENQSDSHSGRLVGAEDNAAPRAESYTRAESDAEYEWQERNARSENGFQAEPPETERPASRVIQHSRDEPDEPEFRPGDFNPNTRDVEFEDEPSIKEIRPADSPQRTIRIAELAETPPASLSPERTSPTRPSARSSDAEAPSRNHSVSSPGVVVDQQRVRYQFGQSDFDENFTIKEKDEEEGGNYVGVFGVAPLEDFGLVPNDPDLLSTLQVWLHDRSEPEGSLGQSQALVSRKIGEIGLPQFFDEKSRARYRPFVAQPGETFALETKSLQLEGEIERVEYLEQDGEVEGIFRDVVINLTARRKT